MAFCPNILKEKWETILNEELSYDIIENAFKELTNIKVGAYYKYFQLKLLHNRTITNDKLYNMNNSDIRICETCHTEVVML